MAIDGLMMHQITLQIQNVLPARINKIQQVSDTEVLFHIRHNSFNHKLIISTHTQYNRISLTKENYASPAQPNNFIMVLRKYIDGGYIRSIDQMGLDRILKMHVVACNEMGDEHDFYVYIELMGKYANVVLVNEENKIIDALKRIPPFENNKRVIFPGMLFNLPQSLDKKNPFKQFEVDENESCTRQFHGFSPLLSREVEWRMHHGESFPQIMQEIETSESLYLHTESGQFHCIALTHLGACDVYPLMQGMDVVYYHQEEKERIRQQSGDLYKLVRKELAKNQQKLPKLIDTLEAAKNCEQYRQYGDLLYAYADQFKEKSEEVFVDDFETGAKIRIPLNIKFDMKQNAKRYYQKYHKSKTAQIMVQEQIELCEKEIAYFSLLESQLDFANFEDAKEIRSELEKLGYLKKTITKGKPKKQNEKPHYVTLKINEDLILIGKNNLQNEYLTFHHAKKNDLWFHAKDYHGSHVILQSQKPSEEILRLAAMLAAYYSQGKNSSSVPVNYCEIKNLKKAKGKAMGQALLSSYKTIYIDPQEKIIQEALTQYKIKS